jgi:hypothetical protein
MKKALFRPPYLLSQEKSYQQVPIPQVNHPSRAGWKNEAVAAYQNAFGKEIKDAPEDLAIPFPKASLGEGVKLGAKNALVKTMFSLLSLFTKERGTHQNGGIGATGTIQFLDNDPTKKFPFAQKGELPITIRHSNASFEDDACSQVRAMAIKIHVDSNIEEDIIMGTGATVPFWSLSSLLTFAKYRGRVKEDNWASQKTWLMESPTAFISAIEAIRLAPKSYTKMSYYSAIPYGIKGTDEFVKFRVMPVDMDRESGLLTPEQQRKIWNQGRLDGNDKPQQYLADEYKERIEEKPIRYVVEAQFRTLNKEHDTQEFFNLSRYWNDEAYPWEPIAKLSVDKVLSDDRTEKLTFWLGNVPEGLDFVKAISPDDYHSIASARISVYPTAQKLRKKKKAIT